MKHLKILALAAMACAALMAVASTASATTLTSGGSVLPAGTTIDLTLKSKTSAILEDTFGLVQNTCTTSAVRGKTSNETGAAVSGPIEALLFEKCTNFTGVIAKGALSITWSSGNNGTVFGSGSKVETVIPTGDCVYGTGEGTALGTLDGVTSGSATMTINAVLPLISTLNGSCMSDARWTAEYSVTSPAGLGVQN